MNDNYSARLLRPGKTENRPHYYPIFYVFMTYGKHSTLLDGVLCFFSFEVDLEVQLILIVLKLFFSNKMNGDGWTINVREPVCQLYGHARMYYLLNDGCLSR